ncbi:DUF6916 family protein [Bradyrhizobium sp. GCM10027634]|uniref:DUF6916 family protein n=1 Tax=unclassified Bradyrhizobium TaxID=2631580 RepID=UPI00188A9877|nr:MULTISPECIES: hypothetical protein [unclassified Bradyrhizobium]MDN5000406.1 hypothetical protein [Bradyrhizobium sp. WYCCWR 12677]QOZ42837.1 hypothetical protein XH89_04660 [Bradyrhizobium sp. CCBAU 53340]
MAPSVDLAALAIDDFTPHLGATFDLHTADGRIALRLVRADRAGVSGRRGGAFSLLFASSQGPWLPQAIYLVEHEAVGTMELFLVPIGPIKEGNGYQAVFA